MKRQKTDNLDRQLSYRLEKALDDDRRADWLDVRERAGMGRALWHWSRRRVLLVAGVLVLAAGAASASTGIIPWLNSTPAPTSPKLYPICKAGDVQAKLFLDKSGRGLSGKVVFVNTGESTCALAGQPKLSLVGPDVNGTRVELYPEGFNLPGSNNKSTVFSPDLKRNPGSYGETVLDRFYEPLDQVSAAGIWWENWCGSEQVKPVLRIEIPNGTTLDLPTSKTPGCLDSSKPSVLSVGKARAAESPAQPNLPLSAQIVTDTGGEPLTLKMNEVFRYQVALTNASTSTFRFGDKCPVYMEAAEPQGDTAMINPWGFGVYTLNCRSVKEITPGETVTFSMELSVGKSLNHATWYGDGTLSWMLAADRGDLSKKSVEAQAPMAVTGPAVSYSPRDFYSAFAPATKEDTFPRQVEERTIGQFIPGVGELVPGSRRVLIPGNWRNGLFAWTTESGRVCYVGPDNGGCDDGKAQTSPISWSANSLGLNPSTAVVPYIVGLARDGVEKIDVNTGSQTLRAELENNGFLIKIPKGQKPVTIVVTMADGSQKRMAIGY
ncbi:MAG: hypothetical protein ABSC36_03865 [Gaiellaceae bacterium]